MAKQKEKDSQSSTRYAGYPLGTLDAALRLGKVVQECGGASGPVPKSVIAAKLKIDESSSAFYAQVATAKTFGVIQGTGDLELTTAASDYFHPTSDSSKRMAELEFFQSPGAFKFLIDRFDGSLLPANEIVKNHLLKQKNVPASWAPRIAAIFRGAAESLSLIDSAGHLRVKAAKHGANNKFKPSEVEDDDEESDDSSDSSQSSASSGAEGYAFPPNRKKLASVSTTTTTTSNAWVFSEGEHTVRVETTPGPLPMTLWEKLDKYVELLKPTT